jgi:hypothetical protein
MIYDTAPFLCFKVFAKIKKAYNECKPFLYHRNEIKTI